MTAIFRRLLTLAPLAILLTVSLACAPAAAQEQPAAAPALTDEQWSDDAYPNKPATTPMLSLIAELEEAGIALDYAGFLIVDPYADVHVYNYQYTQGDGLRLSVYWDEGQTYSSFYLIAKTEDAYAPLTAIAAALFQSPSLPMPDELRAEAAAIDFTAAPESELRVNLDGWYYRFFTTVHGDVVVTSGYSPY